MRSISKASLLLILFGCVMLGAMVKSGGFPQILFPSHDYDYVLEHGLKEGKHIKGEISYSLGRFAAKETYTQYKDSRTAGKTSGYYYMIPVGEGGIAAIYIREDDKSAMNSLTDETGNYLMGGEPPTTVVQFNGVAERMTKNLKGLEGAFLDELENMGYTQSEIDEMLALYSDGECLVLSGPADMSVMYVMLGISFVLILVGIVLIVRNYRREAAYDGLRN